MAYVVCKPCVNCKYGDCAEACPVESFFEGDDQLFINPEECIDCDACVSVCPVDAIFPEDEVPAEWQDYIEKNANFEFSEERRRDTKDRVTHGLDWDASIAGQ